MIIHCSTKTYLLYRLCYNQSTYIAPSFSYYQKLIYMSQHYTTACGFLLMSRCNRYRSVSSYTAALQTTYQIGYQTVTFCCPGYSGTPPVNCQGKSCEYLISYIFWLS